MILAMYHTYCWGSYFYLSWLHTFLVRGRGLSEGEMRVLAPWPFIAGACGNPAILAYSNKLAPTDKPDIAYAMIFPGMTIIKILFVDIAPAFLSR